MSERPSFARLRRAMEGTGVAVASFRHGRILMTTDHTDEYRFGYSPDELERLGNQPDVWADDNRLFLDRADFSEGATVVDLGYGSSFTTLELARDPRLRVARALVGRVADPGRRGSEGALRRGLTPVQALRVRRCHVSLRACYLSGPAHAARPEQPGRSQA